MRKRRGRVYVTSRLSLWSKAIRIFCNVDHVLKEYLHDGRFVFSFGLSTATIKWVYKFQSVFIAMFILTIVTEIFTFVVGRP